MGPEELAKFAVKNAWSAADILEGCRHKRLDPATVLAQAFDLLRAATSPNADAIASDLSIPVHIKYRTRNDEISDRDIVILKLRGTRGPDYSFRVTAVSGNCRTSGYRTFLLSGIQELSDAATGEIISDIPKWLLQRAGLLDHQPQFQVTIRAD